MDKYDLVAWIFARDYLESLEAEQFATLQYRYMPAELKAAYGIEGEYSLQ